MTGNRLPHFSSNVSSSACAWSASLGGVDRFQVASDLLALAPRDVFQARADQVHQTRLDDRHREDRLDRLGEARVRPSTQQIRMSRTPRCLRSVRTCIQNFAPSDS